MRGRPNAQPGCARATGLVSIVALDWVLQGEHATIAGFERSHLDPDR